MPCHSTRHFHLERAQRLTLSLRKRANAIGDSRQAFAHVGLEVPQRVCQLLLADDQRCLRRETVESVGVFAERICPAFAYVTDDGCRRLQDVRVHRRRGCREQFPDGASLKEAHGFASIGRRVTAR